MLYFLKTILFTYLFILERGEGKEKEREKHQWEVSYHVPMTGDLACNPGTCPDWDRTGDPLAQARTQSTELHQPGLFVTFNNFPSYT